MQITPSLRRVGSDIVASYLVADASGVTLIDTGISGQWNDLLAELRAMGRSLDDLRAVLLTHGDTDHIGFAERLRVAHDIPVYVHQADAARARGDEKPPPNARGPIKIGPLLGFLWYAGRRGGLRTRHLGEVQPLQGGETLDLPGAPRVIPLPGHSPGSVAYHLPALDAIAVGDAFTTRNVLTGEVRPSPAPFTDDPGQALASLQALDGIEARWVLPGHGPVWDRGLAEALRLVRERSR